MSADAEPDSGDSTDERQMVVVKTFCNFCGDHMGGQLRQCVDCGSHMCMQTSENGPGCIFMGTLSSKEPFLCVVCEPKRWRKAENPPKGNEGSFPYGFTGYGGRKRSKLCWPLLLVSLNLATLDDRYMRDALQLDLKYHYTADPQNLYLSHADLKADGGAEAAIQLNKGARFLQRSINCNVPANTFVVIDSHSHSETGKLQWGVSASGSPLESFASKLLDKFCGDNLWAAMKAASHAARSFRSEGKQAVWYDASPYSRGGWRALLLSTCGPAMQVPQSFHDLRALVETDVFDFALGFVGESTLPSQIKHAFSQTIERIGVDKSSNIWETIAPLVTQDHNLLEMHGVVLIYKERGVEITTVRKIGRHFTPSRPWGVEFRACGTQGCKPSPRDFYIRCEGNMDVRVTCRICHWTSSWVKEKDRNHVLFRVNATMPSVFWHEYPPTESLKDLFVEVTKRKGRQRAAEDAMEC